MNRQLQLNTQVGDSRRYSFAETPLEMHASSQERDLRSPPSMSAHPNPVSEPAVQQREQPVSYGSSEKVHQMQQEGVIPAYSNQPPHEQHPAHYAPYAYAETPVQAQPHTQMPYHHTYSQPPSSPGPLPVKTNPDAEDQVSRADYVTIAPDANPLQSPKLPYFPPPAAAGTLHAPPIEDLGSFHQPGQILHPNQEVLGGSWSHGLCDCSNIGTCCLGLVCPCIIYGKTQHRLSKKSRKEDPTNMLGYESCNGSCTGMALLCGCQWLMATIQHTRTRKAYGIHGNIASDCLRATCCTCCTLIQDEKEFQKREEHRSRAAREMGATLMSPYTAPGPMTYPPPPK
ncbi:hypothetical protein N7474_000816 [Penicillium riverlandense]|uniref:uncharacterized protein n=1 Tax=Penicillium riverlandense TaxID=1903569 RepID=UPI002549A4B9|nr:uncharacterized protein N7474_000816 [Penicillium riverlandense]KAJ5832505.1 hypothetical protein N7474_000816 [Penicillium riverlandense]